MAPEKIERYQITEVLGSFGNKQHLKARNQQNNQTVLIELYEAEALGTDDRRKEYENRGAVLDSLSSSIILPVIQYGSYGSQAYVVYPFLEGKTLREVQTARKKFSPAEVLPIISRIATALDAVHERNAIFGNLRPENIVFNANGLAHIIGVLLPPRLPKSGTEQDLSYFSPEQLNGKQITRQSDNFALTSLVFELLTGTTPFRGKSREAITSDLAKEIYPKAKELAPDLNDEVESFFETGFKYMSVDRPVFASELVDKFKLVNRLTVPIEGKATQAHNSAVSNDTLFNIRSDSVFAVDFEEFPSWMFLYETIRMRPLGDDTSGSIYDTQVGLTATQERLTTSIARTFEINDQEIIEIQPGIAEEAEEEIDEDYEVSTFFTSARIISILTYVLVALLVSGIALFSLALIRANAASNAAEAEGDALVVAEVDPSAGPDEAAVADPNAETEDTAAEAEPTVVPTAASEDGVDTGVAAEGDNTEGEAVEGPTDDSVTVNLPLVDFPNELGQPISYEFAPPSTTFASDLRTDSFEESQAGWYLYQSANSVRDVVRYDGIIYAATNGGLTRWNIKDGLAEKLTTYDGLGSNDLNQLKLCNLPSPTLVIASENGITLMDLESDEISYLNVANRALINDEVTSIACGESSAFPQLFVGYRSDGVTIHNLNTNDRIKLDRSDGLPTNSVAVLYVVDEDLWISHGIGLTIYDLETDEVTLYSENANNIPSQVINDIELDDQGLIWMATANGLLVGNKSGSWTIYNTENTNIPQGVGLSVSINGDGKVWYGTGFGQICLFDLEERRCERIYRHPSEDLAFTNQITSIFADEETMIYGHFSDGIKFAALGNGRLPETADWGTLYLPNQMPQNEITALAEADGSVWIGTNDGLYQADPGDLSGESWTLFTSDNSPLPNDAITTLTPDPRGGIWIGSSRGVIFFGGDWADPLLTNNQVNSVIVDDDTVWFGTNTGLFLYNGRELTVQNTIPADNIISLNVIGDSLYIGTSNGKLGILTGGAFNQLDSSNSNLSPAPVGVVSETTDGRLLVGNGPDLFELNAGRTLTKVDGPRGFFISSIIPTNNRELIVTTTSNGIFFSERADWEQITPLEGLPTNRIVDSLLDSRGTLWLAAESLNEAGGGLARYIPFPAEN